MPTDSLLRSGMNGLETFSTHFSDDSGGLGALRAARAADPTFVLPGGQELSSLSAEEAAIRQMSLAFEGPSLPQLRSQATGGVDEEFKSVGTERVGLTGTTVVKFRQILNKIPVYGSLVSMELDDNNEVIAINSAIGTPQAVSPLADISAVEAMKVVEAAADTSAPAGTVPRLNYYFDEEGKWRLAYIVENMPMKGHDRPNPLCDVIVDAHSGQLIARLPRTPGLSVVAIDGLGVDQHIAVSDVGHMTVGLRDPELNVHTFDFGFADPSHFADQLPGNYVVANGSAWEPMAVSAHANATRVARFLRGVLQRQNIDNKGGPLYSTINCVVGSESSGVNEWKNAYWNSVQMVYGQARVDGQLLSLATSLDIVAHEMFHGVTERTARLEYARQPGALNESLSDIFGVILSNYPVTDYANWNWDIGDGLGGPAFRSLSSPANHGQPQHMDDFVVLPNTRADDWGGVHINSGIPNRAAYLLMTSTDPNDDVYLFLPDDVAAIFYLALTQHLSRTSNFSQFRKAVQLSIRTLFRNQTPAYQNACVQAAASAFDQVGIT